MDRHGGAATGAHGQDDRGRARDDVAAGVNGGLAGQPRFVPGDDVAPFVEFDVARGLDVHIRG